MELGLYTLSELSTDPATGKRMTARRRIEETIAAARLADEAGLDMFAVGEHHRLDYAVSSPAVVLAAIAAVTSNIRLSTAVTVLGAADPVRVFEDFATLDLLSAGRAEMMVGRGAFGEPFRLAGIAGQRYDTAFIENYELLRRLGAGDRVSWSGTTRPALHDAEIAPRPLQDRIPTWIAVGGSPQSAIRAGRLGAPLALAGLGGPIAGLAGTVAQYHAAGAAAGHPPGALRVAISSHTHVGATSQDARDAFHPYYCRYWQEALGQPHPLAAMSRAEFGHATGPGMMLMVGSAQEVVDKIAAEHALLHHDRFLAQIDIGGQSLSQVAEVIERLAIDVLPHVRGLTG